MTYPPHAMVQFGGTLKQLSGKAEIWSVGVRVAQGSGGSVGWLIDPQAWATAFAPKLRAWFLLTSTGIPNNVTLEWLKVNNIDAAGHYKDSVTHQVAISTALGGSPNTLAPSFCSVAITLETGILRGLAARGRIYLPNYSYSPNGSQISQADVNAVLAAGKGLMDAILTAVVNTDPPVGPVVVSGVRGGAIRTLTGLSVDNIYDVQRRRKNRVSSTRTTGPV